MERRQAGSMTDLQWTNTRVRLGDLKPWEQNPRHITKKQAGRLAQSFDDFGQVETVAISPEAEVYNGHQRLSVLLKLHGQDFEVDARQSSRPLTDDERRKLVVFLHAGATGSWDWDILSGWEAGNLAEWGFDADLLAGWKTDIAALGNLLESEQLEPQDAEPQIDKAAELLEKWQVKTGDLWSLGEHRLLCGDSTKREDVERVMQGEKTGIMVTDPPYGVEYDASWREDYDQFERHSKGKVVNDDRADWADAYRLFLGDVAYVWHAGIFAAEVASQLSSCGFQIRNQIIWRKQHFVFGRGAYHWQHEPCWYSVRKGKKSQWCGDRTQSTVWDIQNSNPMGGSDRDEKTTHGTEKPLECMARPIRNHEFDMVYDPFVGSGTTIIACENLGRKCRAIEISPAYVAVCLQRFQDATGKTPVLIEGRETCNASFQTCAELAGNLQ